MRIYDPFFEPGTTIRTPEGRNATVERMIERAEDYLPRLVRTTNGQEWNADSCWEPDAPAAHEGEWAIFNSDDQVHQRGGWTTEASANVFAAAYQAYDPGYWVGELCPDHPSHARGDCPECDLTHKLHELAAFINTTTPEPTPDDYQQMLARARREGEDHRPVLVHFGNRRTIPAEVCQSCSDETAGRWVPVTQCPLASAQMDPDPARPNEGS